MATPTVHSASIVPGRGGLQTIPGSTLSNCPGTLPARLAGVGVSVACGGQGPWGWQVETDGAVGRCGTREARRSLTGASGTGGITGLLLASAALTFAGASARQGPRSRCERRRLHRAALRVRVARQAASPVLQDGDTVAVVGAGGNVGRLVAQRLAEEGRYRVRGVCRDPAAARQAWASDSQVEFFEADTRDYGALANGLAEAQSVVCTTGVPAFGISGQWERGNHPESVDHFGVKNAANAWAAGPAGVPKRRFVLMSSVGVTRRDSFPYSVLNGGGVLDAKARGERALKALAERRGLACAVVRPGQLFGGPYANNRYLGTLFQLDKDASTRALSITSGDTAVGDTLRSALAGVLVRCLYAEAPVMDFCVVSEGGAAPSEADVDAMLAALGPDGAAEGDGKEVEEQFDKRLGLAAETLSKAVGNVVSGKVFDQAREE